MKLAKKNKSSLSESGRETLTAMIFIAPWVIGFLAFTLYPILSSLYYALCDYNVIGEPEFIGLGNFKSMFRDANFKLAISNTLYMVLFGVLVVTLISLLISVLLNNKALKGVSWFRIIFFIPTLVPLVIACLLWVWTLQYDTGIINKPAAFYRYQQPACVAEQPDMGQACIHLDDDMGLRKRDYYLPCRVAGYSGIAV